MYYFHILTAHRRLKKVRMCNCVHYNSIVTVNKVMNATWRIFRLFTEDDLVKKQLVSFFLPFSTLRILSNDLLW